MRWLLLAVLSLASCATIANDTKPTVACPVSPWIIGDAGLLVFGLVPGVVGLGVDLGTGNATRCVAQP